MRFSLSSLLAAGFDWLAPRTCVGCEQESGDPMCSRCRRALRTDSLARELDGAPVISVAAFHGPLRSAVHRFKYGDRPDLARPLADLLRPALAELELGAAERLVPVPLHPTRLAERGYNQAALLARELTRGTAARCAPRALQRVHATRAQATLSREERRRNVGEAFQLRRARGWVGRRVVLVDDVVTTGNTARACMRVLGAAGAQVVAILCVASAGE
jgi:ComF family protein